MAVTYEPISTTTLTSAQSSVTFGNGGTLPQTYTDLVLIVNSSKTTSGIGNIYLRFNPGTGGTYSDTFIYGTGSSALAGRHNNFTYGLVGDQSNTLSTLVCDVMNYSNSSVYKQTLFKYGDTSDAFLSGIMMWSSTAAVTSLEVSIPGYSFASGSTFTLYGIKAA